MKMKKYFISLLFLTTACTFFTGCFDINRSIKFFPNGGGTETAVITFNKDFFNKIQLLASQDPKWKKRADTLNNNTLFEAGFRADVMRTSGTSVKDLIITDLPDGGKQVTLTYTFDEPSVLVRIVKEATSRYTNGLNIIYDLLKFTEDESGLKFKNTVRNASRQFDDSLSLSMFSSSLATNKITQQIEFAFDVTASNAQTQSDDKKTQTWETNMYDVLYNQVEMTADLQKPEGLDLPYVEKVDKSVGKVSQKDNPLIRVSIYNGNKEEVKIGTGIILKQMKGITTLVTNFQLMNVVEGGGFFSVKLNSDSLAGIDDMTERDVDQKQDLVFLRFSGAEVAKTYKFATMESIIYGTKVKVYYYPNSLSPVVYSMDAMISGNKKWTANTTVIEIKPNKPLSPEGGAVFNEAGEFVGMITKAFDGEVGKIYLVPAAYIRMKVP